MKARRDQASHATILEQADQLRELSVRDAPTDPVIAFPETGLPQATALCDRLRELIEHFPWHQVHPDLKVTMSMGVCADVGAGTAEAMLKKADVLLYQAKESGRNRVCFA